MPVPSSPCRRPSKSLATAVICILVTYQHTPAVWRGTRHVRQQEQPASIPGGEQDARPAKPGDDLSEFDYIIVGAGSAGCLMANRLSANPDHRVLLVEAGGRDNYHWIHIPVGYLYCINNPRTDWMFRTEPDKGLNGRSLIYPRGKTLGGCSSINGMIYMRGQARDYDHWAEVSGDDEWRWEQCLADFMRHEDHALLDDGASSDPGQHDFHGHGGEWRVERQRLNWEVLDDFAIAAEQAGIPRTKDFNRGSMKGWPISRSTSGRVGAGTRPRPSCARRSSAAT